MEDNKLTEIYTRLRLDLSFYAKNCLTISDKGGREVPFILNKAQTYLHNRIEEQLRRTGRVRILIVKGRQQGCSTYTAARFYHKAVFNKGQAVYILSHESNTTQKLFNIVKRYHENVPPPIRAEVMEDNMKSFKFKNGSSYTVGTARNKNTGRGGTIQLFHGCVHEDSLVVLSDGSSVPIKDIELGDLVMTSSGKVAPVTAKTNTGVKQTYEISTWLTNETIKVSKDHKILTQRGWVRTEDLNKEDYIQLPEITLNHARKFYDFTLKNLPKKQNQGTKHREYARIPLGYTFGYLLGYYLAEGHLKKQSKAPYRLCQTQFACHKDETFFDDNLKDFVSEYATSIKEEITEGTNRKRIICYGTFLAELINSICGRVETKHIPDWFFNTNPEFLNGVLKGYYDGDGSKTDPTRSRATCIYERISRQIKRIVTALRFGVPSVAYYTNRKRYGKYTSEVYNVSLNSNCNYRFKGEDIPLEQYERNCKYKRIDGKWFVKIKSVFPADVATTYDIEVGHKDHDFETPIGIISNSEVAFYENTDELQTGLLQSIADLPGTEIILESTANGLGNFFHQACMNALKGEGPYELVFIPWYWQDEYYIKPPSHFHPSEDEKQLMSDYGLSEGQIYWRRQKILAFGAGGEWKFQQEYPLTVHEAFVSSGESMIPPEKIFQARKRSIGIDTESPMILGIDTSRTKDRFVIVPRRGRRMYEPEVYSPKEVGEITTDVGARYVLDAMERYHPDKCFIDVTKDYGVYDWLVNHGYSRLITPVVFSEGALRKELYLNKRAEMLIAVRDWFDAFEVQIPDRDDVQSDISAIPLPKQSAVGKWFIESKENIKQKYGLSTDIMDALALTFAFPVRYNKDNEFGGQILHKKVLTKKNSGSCLTTYQRASKSNRYGKSQLR